MKSARLEHQDSYQTRFESTVTAIEERDGATWLALNESCFYPESGGQPADGGWLEGVAVSDVQKREDTVWHRLERAAFEVGRVVRGELDWSRRYRHMQRHSAQHLLSQAFAQVNPAFETRSVSLSGPVCTLDLSGEPDEGACARAEALANGVAYQNLPIRAFEVDEADLHRYPLRRPPKVSGTIRLVAMGGWELSACGGTHLRGTAEALPLEVLGQERVKRGLMRVRFSAGLEAKADYDLKHRLLSELAQGFNTHLLEVPARVAALQDELSRAKALVAGLQRERLEAQAARLLETAKAFPGGRLVVAVVPAELLKEMGSRLAREADVVALLGVVQKGRAHLLFARGAEAPSDMRELLQGVLPFIRGRGGGREDWAQGSGLGTAGLKAALERAQKLLLEA